MRETLEKILENCMSSIGSIDPEQTDALVDLIFECRRVFIYGSGRSGLVGQLFAVRLVQLGFDVHFVGEMTTPILTEKDLLILLSNTGNTSSVVQTAAIARRIGTKVVSLTAHRESKLAESSDIILALDIKDDDESRKVVPLGSAFEDSAHLFFECLVCRIMDRGNITEEEMRNRHAIWVRSLPHERGRRRDPAVGVLVNGQPAGVNVGHDQNPSGEPGREPADGLFRRRDPAFLVGDAHPDRGIVGMGYALHGYETAVGVLADGARKENLGDLSVHDTVLQNGQRFLQSL